MRLPALLVVLLVSAAAAGRAQESASGAAVSQPAADAFRQRLVAALTRRDRAAVADMVRYRATALASGFEIPIVDRATLLQIFDVVFTPDLRCALEQGRAQVDSSGATFAGGRVRATVAADGLKITRITVPPSALAVAPSPPRRVPFRYGKGRVQYNGRLAGDNVDGYIIVAAKGDLLNTRIERFPGRAATLQVVRHPGGEKLPRPGVGAGEEGPRTWVGILPADGEYRIEVVRRTAYCEAPITYLLTIDLRE